MEQVLSMLAAAAVGTVAGELTRRQLITLRYRRAQEREITAPGRRLWVPVAAGVALALLGAALWPTQGAMLVALAPLALLGPWLAAVDLDVQRLPDKIIYPLLGWQAFAVIMISLATGDPALAWRAVAGGLIAFIGFELLHLCSRGALGFGDVKLGALIGMGASMISWAALWWAFMIGSVSALIWALIKKPAGDQFAFGPWLLVSALAAVTVTSVA